VHAANPAHHTFLHWHLKQLNIISIQNSNYCCHTQQADTTFVCVWNSELPGTGTLRRSAIWQENWHLGTGLRLVRNDGFEESIWSWSKYRHACRHFMQTNKSGIKNCNILILIIC
jgi:hypothetical protein